MKSWTLRLNTWTDRLTARTRRWRVWPAVLLTAAAVACGGYGGSNGYSAPGAPPASGTGATLSVGAITGFGSVHLNGVHFETTRATITVNGQAATQAELQVGDLVEVKGHHDSTTNTDIADEIDFRSNVRGPLTSLDLTAQQIVVLGQTVSVSANTSFGSGISPAGLAGLVVGDTLEISGMADASGVIQATRIERRTAAASGGFRVLGTASATDATAKTLHINALIVDFSTAVLVDFPAAGPKDGDSVEARGTTLTSAGVLQATRLELRTGHGLHGDGSAHSELEGLVTRFASATDFDVGGRAVSTTPTTTFRGGAAADLGLNVQLEVEGSVDANGVLVADRVSFERRADTRLLGQADAVDAVAGTVKLLGVTVTVTATTRFEDHGSQHVNTFQLTDVHTGDWLDIRGTAATDGSVVATRLERRDTQSAVRLAGPVSAAAQPAFTLLQVSVMTTPSSKLQDGNGHDVSAAAFFIGLVGRSVDARGSWDGSTLTADRVVLGEHEDD